MGVLHKLYAGLSILIGLSYQRSRVVVARKSHVSTGRNRPCECDEGLVVAGSTDCETRQALYQRADVRGAGCRSEAPAHLRNPQRQADRVVHLPAWTSG